MSTEESSWLTVVDGEGMMNGDSPASAVGSGFISGCVASGGVVFLLEGVLLALTGSKVRNFFDGVDEGALPSQRDRFEGGVVAGVGPAAPEFGFGR